jgi:hypothetical protein
MLQIFGIRYKIMTKYGSHEVRHEGQEKAKQKSLNAHVTERNTIQCSLLAPIQAQIKWLKKPNRTKQ